jgi:hypothetical protein
MSFAARFDSKLDDVLLMEQWICLNNHWRVRGFELQLIGITDLEIRLSWKFLFKRK